MMDAVKCISLVNIQSHPESHYYFKRTGIHRITATGTSNSYGKTVLMRAVNVFARREFLDLRGRKTLIRRGEEYGIISILSYNGYRVSCVLHREKSKCFFLLEYKGQQIKKTFGDEYESILKIVNFHYMPDEDFSLNTYKTKTTLPFTHFSGTMNTKILDSSSEIPKYKEMLSTVDEKLAIIKSDKRYLESTVDGITKQIELLDTSNLDEMRVIVKSAEQGYEQWKKFATVEYHMNEIVKSTKLIRHDEFNFDLITNPTITFKALHNIDSFLTSIINYTKEYKEESTLNLTSLTDIMKTHNSINKLDKSVNLVKDIFANLKPVDDSIDFDKLKNTINVNNKIDVIFNGLNSIQQIQSKLVTHQEVGDLTSLIKVNESINEVDSGLNRIIGLNTNVKSETNYNILNDTIKAFNSLDNLEKNLYNLSTLEHKRDLIEKEQHLIGLALTEIKVKLKICPTCQQPFKLEVAQ